MVFTVSVRDIEPLEQTLRQGKKIDLPEECKPNSKIIYELLKYVDKILPEFKELSDEEIRTIADSVAYLMRTDEIISGKIGFGPCPLPKKIYTKFYGEDGIEVHLKNDPNQLNKDWKIPEEYTNIAPELFRCYAATLYFMPETEKKLGDCIHAAFKLADVTAFLLSPNDLVNYKYSKEEIKKFYDTLEKESREV